MHKKIKLSLVQFYISHTCNLSCPNCLSLNNFAISGHDFYDHDLVSQWADTIDIDDLTIIGGEPLSNPDLDNWVTGLKSVYPDVVDFKICTNGTLLDQWVESAKTWINNQVVIEISVHSSKHLEQINAAIEKIVEHLDVETFSGNYPDYVFPEYYREYNKIIFYKQFPAFIINYNFEFSEWGVKSIEPNKLNFYRNNAEIAHKHCPYKDCHYIYKGEMYKCGTLVGAKALIERYHVDTLSNILISHYKPISLTDPDIKNKLSTITEKSIPQCAMCPVGEHNSVSIENATIKKLPAHKPHVR